MAGMSFGKVPVTVRTVLELTPDELEWLAVLSEIDRELGRLRPQLSAAVESLADERVWVPTAAGVAALGGAA